MNKEDYKAEWWLYRTGETEYYFGDLQEHFDIAMKYRYDYERRTYRAVNPAYRALIEWIDINVPKAKYYWEESGALQRYAKYKKG